MMHICAVK